MTVYKAAPRRGEVPWSMGAERAVVGAALIDEDEVWAEDVPGVVRTPDFFFPPHRAAWAAMLRLRKEHTPITVPSVAAMLATMGVIDDFDELTAPEYAEPYLMAVMGETWAATGCIAHARMVRDYAERRELIERGTQTVRDAYAGRASSGRGGVAL